MWGVVRLYTTLLLSQAGERQQRGPSHEAHLAAVFWGAASFSGDSPGGLGQAAGTAAAGGDIAIMGSGSGREALTGSGLDTEEGGDASWDPSRMPLRWASGTAAPSNGSSDRLLQACERGVVLYVCVVSQQSATHLPACYNVCRLHRCTEI